MVGNSLGYVSGVESALDIHITKFVYNVGKTKFTKYIKNIPKINIYARKVERKHLTMRSKLNFVLLLPMSIL